jgi:RHS repeat-associated protein
MTAAISSRFCRSSRRARDRAVATAAAVVAAVSLLAGAGPASGAPRPARPRPPVPAQKPVRVHPLAPHRIKIPAEHVWHRPAVSWPAPGIGRATFRIAPSRESRRAAKSAAAGLVAGPTPLSSRAGTLPVWVGPPASNTAGQRSAATARVAVAIAPRRAATALGVTGIVFTVSRPASSAALRAHVSLDYASFAYAYGGQYAADLRLVTLPGCALTAPRNPACRQHQALRSADSVTASRLGADVTFRPGQNLIVLAANTSTSGSGGDYGAAPLSEAGTWAAGGSSGAFTFQYPVTVPPVPGGLEPDVALNYNSQAVDGLTASDNPQASWIGDGWDFSPGYVERDYETCSQDKLSPAIPSGDQTPDLCWSANNVTTLTLNGTTTTLVDDPKKGWHAEADGSERVRYVTGGPSNGTHDNGYWVVTMPNGVSYYFGSVLPGYASGDAQDKSTWTVPVYNPRSGDPCYNSTFANSACPQAWRWQLDYVTDTFGNAMAYLYNTETNYYAADKGSKGTTGYIQGGALAHIWYGIRDGSTIYGTNHEPTGSAEVNFTAPETRSTDVPSYLACASGASCQVWSPSLWSKFELTGIDTQTTVAGSMSSVDSWALSPTWPTTGDASPPPMWLSQIARTGEDGATPIGLPPVKFTPQALPNRVVTPQDTSDGYTELDRNRLHVITNETGGVITVTYQSPSGPCMSGQGFPAEDVNTLQCYPAWWDPTPNVPFLDWWNKYVVASVTEANTYGGGEVVATNYSYAGAAWRKNTDTLTRSRQRTWDVWRGFQTVTTETGTGPADPVTKTVDTYLQGMSGDPHSDGTTPAVQVTSTVGNVTVTDSNQWAGTLFEHTVYDGAGSSTIVADTVTTPWTSAATADQTQPGGLPDLQAFMTGTAETQLFTALASGKYRESDTTYGHDSSGRVTSVSDVPDTNDSSQDTCTTTSYATNSSSTGTYLLDLPAEIDTVSVPCTTTPTLPGDAVSDDQYFYDGSTTLGAAPSAGKLTETRLATSYNGSTPVYTTESKTGYDGYGRVTSATDADGRTTTTGYTPATGAEPTKVTVTDPMQLATVTTYDPARDLPLTVTDPAGYVTTRQYDAVGRITGLWKPGHAAGTSSADQTYSYTIGNKTSPSIVTTNQINTSGGYTTSEVLYDSLGRQAETQTETADGNRDITDTYYNTDGWVNLVSDPYWTNGAPSNVIVAETDNTVPSQTGYVYDGTGRVISQIAYNDAVETWHTDTAYGGDYTTVTPPAGGIAETTYTDGRGLTSYIYSYHGAPPASPPAPGSGSLSGSSGYDQTAYSYTPAGKLAQVTDNAGNIWKYAYNLAGNQTSATDPDTGKTTTSYDAAGQLLSTTNAAGSTLSYVYDADGRATAEYDSTTHNAANQLAAWTYDTLAAGYPSGSTAYVGGSTGQAYKENFTGYNVNALPLGLNAVIPSAAGKLAGTYKTGYAYNVYTSQISQYSNPAGGGLAAETLDIGYDNAGHPNSIESTTGTSYVSSLTYTELGQPFQYNFGTTSLPASVTDSYDAETGRLHQSIAQTGSSPVVTVDSTQYSYDVSGNILEEADTPANGPTQVQCFQYYLGQLTQAWAQGSTTCAGTPSQSAEGGKAPYWNSYTYNSQNDLTKEVTTPQTGQATTYTNAFPATTGADGPHAIDNQQASGAQTGTTSFTYNAAGQTTAIGSSAGTQNLAWNNTGTLASITPQGSSTATASYLYDADGHLLLQTDPQSVTLYLPDEQLVLDTSTTTGAITGTRYYTLGGVTVAARNSDGTVDYLAGDQQGTDTIAIDSQSLAVTRRYYDPNGNPIGTPPPSWPGTKGFVGGTTDTSTGLTNLGAREYNPGTASFISADALLNLYDPQDFNAYTYAHNNPVTYGDPTGLRPTGPNNCGEQEQNCSSVTPDQPPLTWSYIWNMAVNVTGGTINWGYNLAKTVAKFQAFALLGPLGTKAIRALPARIPIGNPANSAYQLSLALGPVFIPGVGEEDAAVEGLGVLDRLALETKAAEGADAGAGAAPSSLIHYTNEAGLKGINDSGELWPSSGPVHARFGPGQYLTDITPGQIGGRTIADLTPEQIAAGQISRGQLAARLFGRPTAWSIGRTSNWLEIDVTGLDLLNPRPDTWLIPGESPLDLTGRILGSGVTPG